MQTNQGVECLSCPERASSPYSEDTIEEGQRGRNVNLNGGIGTIAPRTSWRPFKPCV
jgi:hypothetical protein